MALHRIVDVPKRFVVWREERKLVGDIALCTSVELMALLSSEGLVSFSYICHDFFFLNGM